ncbi:MAG TPA: glycosyltransferase [Kiritimatiellia bacterium]|nr:glycosyltransferase [Kiritimatiellia bacterium]
MQISVVIPTYNSASTIEATLASVLKQSQAPSEIVVVDDASSDNTLEILKRYGDRIRVLPRKKNAGCADVPRYEGVAASQSEWVALIDADDLWDPTKLEVVAATIATRPEIPLWHHYVRVIDRDGKGDRIRHEGTIPATGLIGRDLLHRCFICTSAVVVRREAWLQAQRLDQIRGFGTEIDFFLALARNAPIGFIDQVLGSYRYTTSSISRKNWKRFSRDVVAMRRIYKKGLWKGIASRREMRAILVDACREDADHHRYNHRPGRSLWFCGQGLRYRPLDPGLWLRVGKLIFKG